MSGAALSSWPALAPRAPADGGANAELLRALGALCLLRPADTAHLAEAAGLPSWSAADHTEVFVLDLPPYAAIHLGPEGKLGGEAADRAAGIWRVLGLTPPAEPDHLGVLLTLYAELGDAARACRTDAASQRLERVAATVLVEHLWPWCPGYLDAVADRPALRPWAKLLSRALSAECRRLPEAPPARQLPRALRTAPPPVPATRAMDDLLDALVAPIRSGVVLTGLDLGRAGRRVGAGLRRGERRFALRGLLEQEPVAVLQWLSQFSAGWADRHRARDLAAPDPVARWWAGRASHTAARCAELSRQAERAACAHGCTPPGATPGPATQVAHPPSVGRRPEGPCP